MRIEGNKIIFKTGPEFFDKEESGHKSNTVRELNQEESVQLAENYHELKYIRIENTETGAFFERVLTDISFFADRYIFSWKWVY